MHDFVSNVSHGFEWFNNTIAFCCLTNKTCACEEYRHNNTAQIWRPLSVTINWYSQFRYHNLLAIKRKWIFEIQINSRFLCKNLINRCLNLFNFRKKFHFLAKLEANCKDSFSASSVNEYNIFNKEILQSKISLILNDENMKFANSFNAYIANFTSFYYFTQQIESNWTLS